MARTIPLIRAASLFPMLRWLKQNQQNGQGWLAAVGIEKLTEDSRERPVPLIKVFELFRSLAARHGPDACARIVSPHSLQDLGVLGQLILGARTPREALTRVVHYLPRYSTHEIVQLRPVRGGLRFQAGWALVLDQEMQHLSQQFTAALVTFLCRATIHPTGGPRMIHIRPHPVFGVDHLQQIYGVAVTASGEAVLSVDLDDGVLDATFRFAGLTHAAEPPQDWVLPHGKGSLSPSVCLALNALHSDEPVRIEQIAALAGLSKRSFQRVLSEEGTSFRLLLDELRRTKALAALDASNKENRMMAGSLGYSARSSLSRAVRRWTGSSPRDLYTARLP